MKIKGELSEHSHTINKVITSISLPEGVDIDDGMCYKIRKLEKSLIEIYAPGSSYSALVYQWLNVDKVHYYSYFKMSKKTFKVMRVIIYILIVILLSCLGSALWQMISDTFSLYDNKSFISVLISMLKFPMM